MSLQAFSAGRLDQAVTAKLFKQWSHKRSPKAGLTTDIARGEPKTIAVLLCPLVFVTEHEHGVARHRKDRKVYHAPVSIAATLARDGQLTATEADPKPQINREFLEPSRPELTIGTIENVDKFYMKHAAPAGPWSQTVNYAHDLVQYVSKKNFDALVIEGTKRSDGLVLAEDKPTEVRGIIEGYDLLQKADNIPALLHRLIDGVEDRGLLDQTALFTCHRRHLGQMKNGLALTPSQRESLAHFLSTDGDAADILAVNGPPGTGKTTLIQSVVATLWVHAALKRQECPVIVAAAATNQAATNIIRDFDRVKSSDSDYLSRRWLADKTSLGMFMAAHSANTEGWQTYTDEKNYFAKETLETQYGFERNRDFFLKQFRAAFPDDPVDNLVQARDTLHTKIAQTVTNIETIVQEVHRLTVAMNGQPISLAACADRRQALRREADQKAENAATLEVLAQKHLALQLEWANHQQSEPFWISLLSFIGPVRRRRMARDSAFVLAKKSKGDMYWAKNSIVRSELDEQMKSVEARLAEMVAQANEDKIAAHSYFADYDRHFDLIADWCLRRDIDIAIDSIWASLDTIDRYRAFLMAMHYWEAMYLIEVEADLAEDYQDKRSAEKLLRQYRRLAKIAPCFVVTLHTLPKRFTGWRGEDELMADAIDLLVLDEAGQAAPDIAALSFAFAKRALVVGDLKQISPIWPIVDGIDQANVTKFIKLDDAGYENFCARGRSASSGTIMAMAQQASHYTKFGEFGRGMFLSEHFRCQDDIIAYCNELSYQNQLKPCRGNLTSPHPLPAMGFAHIDGDDRTLGGSRENIPEAQVIATWIAERQNELADYYQVPPDEIGALLGIVTPFAAQAQAIRRELGKRRLPVAPHDRGGITVGTVHALQGAERKIILFSPTYGRSYRGATFFGHDETMLNVAVSRAQDSFLVFGNMRLFGDRAFDPASSLLGRLILRPEQEITDIMPVIPVKEAPPATDLLRDLEGHQGALREAFCIARRQLTIVSPFLAKAALADDNIEQQIKETRARGAKVSVCTDPKLHSKPAEFNSCVKKLRDAGAAVFFPKNAGIHSKMLWADRQLLAIGSFNWLSAVRRRSKYQRYEVSAIFRSSNATPLINVLRQELDALVQPPKKKQAAQRP